MSEEKKKLYLHRIRLCGIWLGSVALFYAVVCTPISQWISTDIGVNDRFRLVWDILQNIVRFSFYWITAAFVLDFTRLFRMAKPILILACAASALLNFGSLAAGLIMTRDLDTILPDLLGAGLSVLLDAVQTMLFRLIAYLLLQRRAEVIVPSLPIFLCATIPAVVQVVGRLIYDIHYGLPMGVEEVLLMIGYYFSDLANIAIGYFVILFINDRPSKFKEMCL